MSFEGLGSSEPKHGRTLKQQAQSDSRTKGRRSLPLPPQLMLLDAPYHTALLSTSRPGYPSLELRKHLQPASSQGNGKGRGQSLKRW